MKPNINEYEYALQDAVRGFWAKRKAQITLQQTNGKVDHGMRGAVTGGAQMNGFAELLGQIARDIGVPDAAVFRDTKIELPGFFRPTKKWDALVVADGKLVAAIELKSQVGPSFGNNFNNRAEEAIGSATDLWKAYGEGAFQGSPRPWLGYVFLLEDCLRSQSPVAPAEPHFPVFPEFRAASYARRYELLCRRLMREGLYDAAAFFVSPFEEGMKGLYQEPAPDLSFREFYASFSGRLYAHLARKGNS
jgi:hypothetical protein